MNIIIDAEQIREESYFNLCAIASATGYANPVAALAVTKELVACEKDENGNITSARLLDTKEEA
jgi:hypothetical protein